MAPRGPLRYHPPVHDPPRSADVIIVGAGIAGLACAGALVDAGRRVIVVDKARGVGGRCATRRFLGDQPVDHGLAFLHGADPAFLAAIEAAAAYPGDLVEWPVLVEGRGRPCQPRAFSPHERRLAFRGGLTAFPKALARGLDLRLEARALALAPGAVTTDRGVLHAPDLVITAPAPQALDLLAGLPPTPERDATAQLLGLMVAVPCLSLVVGYPADRPAPPWDLLYPEDGPLTLVAHDSRKRLRPAHHALVLQATPRWSRAHLEEPSETWSAALLAEAASHLGLPPLADLAFVHPHRWRYARLDGPSQLAAPILYYVDEERRVGVAGEAFAPGGGVQAAWLSGQELASRLLHGAPPPAAP